MINTILIDDEDAALDVLRITIEKYCPEINVKGIYNAPEKGLDGIRQLNPELVFLDVQMPQMSGFDLLQQVSPVTFDVIFVSAYDQYAIKAIKFSALDYLLKPIDVDDLIHAVKKLRELPHRKNIFQYQAMLNNIRLKSGSVEKLAVPSPEGLDFFDTQDIIFCKADGSYTEIILQNNKHVLVSKNLADFENLLTMSGFCRVHHSYLVNLKHVQKYVKGEGGYVILTDNHMVDISRRKKEEFLSLLDKP